MSYLLFDSISKNFPGVRALQNVSFKINKGTVHGLIGENGAGKSTLIKILSGFYQPDTGTISIADQPRKFTNPLDAIHSGIRVIHQELQLVSHMTVAENLNVGNYMAKNGFVSWRTLFTDARLFLDKIGLSIDERAKISQLTLGQQQMVEIAKAVKKDATIIAFDEPTSSLSKQETDLLFSIINSLREQGKVLIYISHRMAEIFELCDACTVLKDGCHVATHHTSTKTITRENLIHEMTGRDLKNVYDYRQRSAGEVVLEAEAITGPGISNPCDVQVRCGEIVGLFGLIGAGRSELAQMLYGLVRKKTGTLRMDGVEIRQRHVRDSINHGIMFCTEDRKKEGVINGRGIWENINISSRRHFAWLKAFINIGKEYANADKQVSMLNIKTPDLYQDIVNLSGGNQQKVILGRWLSEVGMKVLIIDEPTRGIDVGAKNEIYHILYDLAQEGVGIIMISSELPEIMGVCDRLYVMREGSISHEFDRHEFNESKILEYAFPVSKGV